ncbi:MAG TPA: type 1 glutamine amidotransferase [Solirubrobacteraceae bacterium]|nr:type 1 glutamine amidotransferase [Solirubrobacteraceae bacterium]
MRPGLILQHGPTSPPGLFGEWARSRGVTVEVHETFSSAEAPYAAGPARPMPAIDQRPFVCCLGSKHSPLDRDVPVVAATIELIARAVAQETPVLGLCYGGQVLADVLGGVVEPAPEAELGWYSVESDDPDLVASGPWLEWHYQRFTLPPGAREVARSAAGVQAFTRGPHLGTQFHPESTIEVVAQWARTDRERLEALGVTDAEQRLESGRDGAAAARANAFALFDGFWTRAQRAERRES